MTRLRTILAQEGLTKRAANTYLSFMIQEGDEPGTYTILSSSARPGGEGSLHVNPAHRNLSLSELVRKFDQMTADRAQENYALAMRNGEPSDPFYKTWVTPVWQGGPKALAFSSIKSKLPAIAKIADRGFVAVVTDGLRGWEVEKARSPRKKVPVPKAASREPKTIVIRGPARALGERDLAGILLWPGRNYPSLSTTGPQDTRSEAMAEAKALAQGYTRQTWPGGMAQIVALVHFPDHPHSDGGGEGSWAGVVNTYYSFS